MSGPDAEGSSVAVLAEKPSVARDIARVLGATKQGQGYLHGNGYVVTWAIGHLVALAQPHEIQPEWKQWRRDLLPMLPRDWPLVVYEKTQPQFEVVRKILNSPKVARVVCATDAGREGELIFRYIYEAAACCKPFSRLWISSLTPDAIRKGFGELKDGAAYDPLADAARGRSRADWLVGMNLSRAYTLAWDDDLSVGRVQTPTLAMLVERELAIRSFVPEDYIEVAATFSPIADEKYQGTWFREPVKDSIQMAMRLPADGQEAERIVARAHTGAAHIESIQSETQRMAPPLLYDLTELQRHANRLYGFSAQKTLETAQALYESRKLISYPRTDSRHLSQDVARTLPEVVRAIEAPYHALLAPGTGERPLGRRFVDDSKVTDHHAIIPTPVRAGDLTADERRIYDLICRRLLSAWHGDHIWAVTTVITAISNPGVTDHYHTTGTAVQQAGWKALDVVPERRQERAPETPTLPPGLAQGQSLAVVDVEALKKKTRPPKRFTEGTLLTAMETAGKTLDEKELSDAMKETGLGTPATRASIIEVLLKRGYIVRDGKVLEATPKGIHLIEVVHPEVKSPAMTGQWEAYLKRIQRGTAKLEPFIEGIENYVREVVGKVGKAPTPAASPQSSTPPSEVSRTAAAPSPQQPAPASGASLTDLLHSAFGYESFRPNQEAVCEAVIAGRDVLLVMPTGSGKSLCYQLPGVARGGATLVISPLIALMEDQVAKLKAQNCAVERIHSGRDRAASRQACIDYLEGRLQFLFVAPERLRVPGFPAMLAKRKPNLVAIDEAHCISQWGHDFRPDYRMIGQHLPHFRPAPVIAMTATATPLVQNDIIEQLGLGEPTRFIHGFRRANIAVEVVEVPPSERAALARELLQDAARRPAIVYVPTRREADSFAAELKQDFPAAAYHAGLESDRRKKVQTAFFGGELQVVVATIAFGMGIDKPDIRTVIHTALPGSLEAYYQEVGRAGRDGAPSRAVLMHAYADRFTHDFFFDRDYPDVSVLENIFGRLVDQARPKEMVRGMLRMDPDVFDKALEKLWIHGGALVDAAENLKRGAEGWRELYVAQAEHKLAQIELMIRYTQSSECRMLGLVRHFGDYADDRQRCGICDFCAPDESIAQSFRPASDAERKAAGRILAALKKSGRKATGRLHSEVFADYSLDRDGFEQVLGAMARAGWVEMTEASFQQEGRRVDYRLAALSAAGLALDAHLNAGAVPPFEMKLEIEAGPRRRKKGRAAHREKGARKRQAVAPAAKAPPPAPVANVAVEKALRDWRLAEAKRRNVPAFRILSDKSLQAIAADKPSSVRELLEIPGIGARLAEQYGAQIFRILERG
ncbi:MAG TPA: DNA topoisomerase 3 [Bryobacteraceae bacterium]|jgi:DNA topoisomerase-3|nr:DNA topoisomerase 3 [Bryobacteraceae bacterium]